jgi:hypothetical protein
VKTQFQLTIIIIIIVINFFFKKILICEGCSQLFELLRHFEGNIISLFTATSPCILISTHDNVLDFISVYIQSSLLISN